MTQGTWWQPVALAALTVPILAGGPIARAVAQEVVAVETASITVVQLTPSPSAEPLVFSGSSTFVLDTEPLTITPDRVTLTVEPGAFRLTQVDAVLRRVTAINCSNGAIGSLERRDVAFRVLAGDNIVCSFTTTERRPPAGKALVTVVNDHVNATVEAIEFSHGGAPESTDTDVQTAVPSSRSWIVNPGEPVTLSQVPSATSLPTAITCDNGVEGEPAEASVVVEPNAGDNIVCRFVNVPSAPTLLVRMPSDGEAADPYRLTFTNGGKTSDPVALATPDMTGGVPSEHRFTLESGTVTFTDSAELNPVWSLAGVVCNGVSVEAMTLEVAPASATNCRLDVERRMFDLTISLAAEEGSPVDGEPVAFTTAFRPTAVRLDTDPETAVRSSVRLPLPAGQRIVLTQLLPEGTENAAIECDVDHVFESATGTLTLLGDTETSHECTVVVRRNHLG